MMNIIYNIYNLIASRIINIIINKFYDDNKFIIHWINDNLINNNDNYLIGRYGSGNVIDGDGKKYEYELIIRVLEDDMKIHTYMRKIVNKYTLKIKSNDIVGIKLDLYLDGNNSNSLIT